jgi:competence protein ComEA
MGPSTPSDFRSSTEAEVTPAQPRLARAAGFRLSICLALFAGVASAQLPDGPGKAETQKLCSQCHEIERSISLRQDRAGWQATLDKMGGLGMKSTEKEATAVLDYLAAHYPASDVPPLNVNTARAIDFESALSLPRSQAARIVQYREKNGGFNSIDDLKKVPGIDAAKIDAKKDRLVFK